jgi:hypothetical protein
MAKLRKIETDYRFYEYELTEEEYQLYQEDEDTFWDEVDPEWEFTSDKQVGDEIEVIEE